MDLTTQQLADFLGGELKGRADLVLKTVASLKNAGSMDLSYAEEKFHEEARSSKRTCREHRKTPPAPHSISSFRTCPDWPGAAAGSVLAFRSPRTSVSLLDIATRLPVEALRFRR